MDAQTTQEIKVLKQRVSELEAIINGLSQAVGGFQITADKQSAFIGLLSGVLRAGLKGGHGMPHRANVEEEIEWFFQTLSHQPVAMENAKQLAKNGIDAFLR